MLSKVHFKNLAEWTSWVFIFNPSFKRQLHGRRSDILQQVEVSSSIARSLLFILWQKCKIWIFEYYFIWQSNVFIKTILVVVQVIGNEMPILCIIILKFNTCTIFKIIIYCSISPPTILEPAPVNPKKLSWNKNSKNHYKIPLKRFFFA